MEQMNKQTNFGRSTTRITDNNPKAEKKCYGRGRSATGTTDDNIRERLVLPMGRKTGKYNFQQIIKTKKLPILTLDVRWHELFPEDEKTAQIKELEKRVNNLLKKQGRLGSDIKDMKKLKNQLMNDIVVNMDIGPDPIDKTKEKKLDQNKQFINELNERITNSMDELSELPYQIKEENEKLMLESVNILYDRMTSNKAEIKEIAAWIAGMREDLKNKILEKQDLATKNNLIYAYMHDLLGADLINEFDKEYPDKL